MPPDDPTTRHVQRTLHVRLALDSPLWQRLRELSWQAARYRNLFLRARWAEAMQLRVDPSRDDAHDVTKWIRRDAKGELSGSAYAAAERETAAVWQRHKSRILAGAPLPEWKPTAALAIRGHKHKEESGVRLERLESGQFVVHLQAQAQSCEGGSWLTCPLDKGINKDYLVHILEQMVTWQVPIAKASLELKPGRHRAILHLAYAKPVTIPPLGQRTATLGPIDGHRLMLRTDTTTRDYSHRLHTVLIRKDAWEAIRRRASAQIGRHKGAARTKRRVLARMSWDTWLDTYLHQWSHELITWLHGEGVATLRLIGLGQADWAAFRFQALLTYKGDERGITVTTEADLEDPTVERLIKGEVRRKRTRVRKAAQAVRELVHQHGQR